MANELTANVSLAYAKGNIATESLALPNNQKYSQTGTRYAKGAMTVPTTAGGTAIDIAILGGGTLGICMFKNNDATNIIEILTAVSGTVIATMNPGEITWIRFPSTITAPAALSLVATCQLQFLILEN